MVTRGKASLSNGSSQMLGMHSCCGWLRRLASKLSLPGFGNHGIDDGVLLPPCERRAAGGKAQGQLCMMRVTAAAASASVGRLAVEMGDVRGLVTPVQNWLLGADERAVAALPSSSDDGGATNSGTASHASSWACNNVLW